MTLLFHELKQGKVSLIIWSAVLSFMLAVCVIIYPEMSGQMDEASEMLSNMGSFSEAFGMDQINFGEFIGYFGIECGNVLGLGGAVFAAILGCSVIAKEEKEKTAEFLLTHPIRRSTVLTQKLLSVTLQTVIMNLAVMLVTLASVLLIGEEVNTKIILIFLSYLLMQLQVLFVSFCISSFSIRGGLGIGIGVSIGSYFVNILSNLTDELEMLKYITPFAYTDSGYIIENNSLDIKYILIGACICAAAIAVSYIKYSKKDIS